MKQTIVEVSIGNVSKALVALRSYGLTKERAEAVLSEETHVAVFDYGVVPRSAISPDLLEIFGEQHVEDALNYAYFYMDQFNLSWEELHDFLVEILEVFSPEDVILDPELIRIYIEKQLAGCEVDEAPKEE